MSATQNLTSNARPRSYYPSNINILKGIKMADEEDLGLPVIPELYKPPALLPISQLKDVLLYTIETYPITIVVGETGSGKTTQIPQMLYGAGWTSDGTQIAVTQVNFLTFPPLFLDGG
jgi:type IV secretory pathway ATPase VirB11/archaellum biosynthesis ATPase